ncbi:putative sulfate exporter family transporter [Bradyrhizobium sp. NP1]|uniref:YeiH family protein n=1 Tax=Bradyrhizobium sp. NP1 TaxID=3049772 RepID=UPI0025A58F43|nr:putative sulfate exporter family transporter [Bradyrhizobium sp. NP1]WJR79888.1 putative sulfate exporter family transporter [Bradyrhizobium sp. NP1]
MRRGAGSFITARAAASADRLRVVLPGVVLCGLIAIISFSIERVEQRFTAHPYIEPLVFAILLGIALRSVWNPVRAQAGIAFSGKVLLEVAVVLLGVSISAAAIAASGPLLLAAIVGTVIASLVLSFGLSRMLGLSNRLSILIACGNSICGNSAIAAVAPVVGADADEIACSISFTAILGVAIVLGLPLLIPLLHLSDNQYGILAGLTVYAVPQVLAATVPAGIVSAQIGTLVKMTRVLLLGPIVLGLSLFGTRLLRDDAPEQARANGFGLFGFVPWFILGFVALAMLRSFQLVPDGWIAPLTKLSTFLTVISMAALGLGVDLGELRHVGGRVTAAVALSLILLLLISIGLIHLFQ